MEREEISILLVDDRADKMIAMEALLLPLGYNIIKAQSGKEALRLLLHRDVTVILLDVHMPVMDGFETATLIRQRKTLEHTPIIFVSSIDNSAEDLLKGFGLGGVDFIQDPIRPEILQAKVAAFVELAHKNKELEKARQILDEKVQERTHQLGEANEQLKREIADRSMAETEIRRLNQALEERVDLRTQELKKSTEQLEAFCYTVAHDLRAPLRAMRGFSQALLEEYADPMHPIARDYLKRIYSAGSRMDALIRDLLGYSRIDRMTLVSQPINLELLVDDIVAQLAEEVSSHAAVVKVEKPLPMVQSHRELAEGVISNLLSNAIKFHKPHQAPNIRVRGEEMEDGVRVWVEDDGIGIDAEYHQRIFRMFEKLHSGDLYPGNGAGLAIVQRSMARMGGKAGVESQSGQGSRFWVEFPKSTPADASPAAQTSETI